MPDATVFNSKSYREYFKSRLERLGPRSGQKSKAAQALGVHTTFISQVALGKADLSLEQAEGMNEFFHHDEDESEFFLYLVILERTQNPRLQKRFQKKVSDIRNRRLNIKSQLPSAASVQTSLQEKFYSSHLYGLAHVLASIPKFQKRKALQQALGLSDGLFEEILRLLLDAGILRKEVDQVKPTTTSVHLAKDSPHIWRHHTNWRTSTIQRFGFSQPDDLHYSLCLSCSLEDAQRIRDSLLQQLKSLSKIVGQSKDEAAFVYCFDFFKWI